jgi:hypothetical protein
MDHERACCGRARSALSCVGKQHAAGCSSVEPLTDASSPRPDAWRDRELAESRRAYRRAVTTAARLTAMLAAPRTYRRSVDAAGFTAGSLERSAPDGRRPRAATRSLKSPSPPARRNAGIAATLPGRRDSRRRIVHPCASFPFPPCSERRSTGFCSVRRDEGAAGARGFVLIGRASSVTEKMPRHQPMRDEPSALQCVTRGPRQSRGDCEIGRRC